MIEVKKDSCEKTMCNECDRNKVVKYIEQTQTVQVKKILIDDLEYYLNQFNSTDNIAKKLNLLESIKTTFKNINKKEIDILINITNDSWFGTRSGPYQHFYISRIKSLIANKSLLRVSNNGISAIINPNGKIKSLILTLQDNANYKTHIFVTGMHNLKKFGSTYDELQIDKIKNNQPYFPFLKKRLLINVLINFRNNFSCSISWVLRIADGATHNN